MMVLISVHAPQKFQRHTKGCFDFWAEHISN